jgi:hypothetical protein
MRIAAKCADTHDSAKKSAAAGARALSEPGRGAYDPASIV